MPHLTLAEGHAVEYLVRGSGRPVTVFAHGLAGTIPETRPLASGVLGSRAFLSFRGHGGSSAPDDGWTYAALADELRAVADATSATRALGVSMGAGALCRVLADTPDRFEKAVFFIPAVLDELRADIDPDDVERFAATVDSGDETAVADLLFAELPEAVQALPQARPYVEFRAKALAGTEVVKALRAMPWQLPLEDRSVLGKVDVPVLVVAQQGDDLHPVAVAEELAACFPNATLHVFSEAGAMWLAKTRLRELIAGFLNGGAGGGHPGG